MPRSAKSALAKHFLLGIGLLLIASLWDSSTLAQNVPTLRNKHIVGYQGWFGCSSDAINPEWRHWSRDGRAPNSNSLVVDLWPDTSEFDADERCDTGLKTLSGEPAYLFSSENAKTVARHFRWMKISEIDGAAVQRFISDTSAPPVKARMAAVLRNVRRAAEAEGLGFFVMYDLSGALNASQILEWISTDWNELVKNEHILASPAYIRHNEKPVVGIWGLGFNDANHPESPDQAAAILHFFHQQNLILLGGVPTHWRTLNGDSRTDPAWEKVYQDFDILSPWEVGRYTNAARAGQFASEILADDIVTTKRRGQGYMAVIFPGFSFHNASAGRESLDAIPRECGMFYREQANNAIRLGAEMIYTAMFDEVNEGTAIMKIVRDRSQAPNQVNLIIPDVTSNCSHTSDFYLMEAKRISETLRK